MISEHKNHQEFKNRGVYFPSNLPLSDEYYYHGTSLERANKILQEGLRKQSWARPIYLSPSKETAKEYAEEYGGDCE